MIKKRAVKAADLRDGILLDFDGGEPAIIRKVFVGDHMVEFTANGTKFTVERDEELVQVTRLTLVCGE